MEGMLDNLSQPVAFATAPLGTEPPPSGKKSSRRDGSSSSGADVEQPHTSTFFTRLGLDGKFKSSKRSPKPHYQWLFPDLLIQKWTPCLRRQMRKYLRTKVRRHIVNGLGVTKRVLQGNELSESFYMIPSDSEPSRSALKKENGSLKQELEAMSKRLAAAERIMQLRKEQDQQLRESIVMARHQVILLSFADPSIRLSHCHYYLLGTTSNGCLDGNNKAIRATTGSRPQRSEY